MDTHNAWYGWSGDFGGGYDGEVAWEFAPDESPHALASIRALSYQLHHRLDRDAHLAELYRERSPLPDRTVDGRRQHVVRMSTAFGGVEIWYFDAVTGLLSRIESTEYADKNAGSQAVWTFEDYRELDGVRVPYQLGIDKGERPFTITITSIVNNAPIAPAELARPPATPRSPM